jgi:hypothetical protein
MTRKNITLEKIGYLEKRLFYHWKSNIYTYTFLQTIKCGRYGKGRQRIEKYFIHTSRSWLIVSDL